MHQKNKNFFKKLKNNNMCIKILFQYFVILSFVYIIANKCLNMDLNKFLINFLNVIQFNPSNFQ